jgi:aminoglycoside 3-N-acetyltransferase
MTRDELNRLFETLSLRANHLVVHASLSSFGDVEGGANSVCTALVDAVGDSGTIVMPAFTYAETLTEPTPSRGAPQPRGVAYHPDLPVTAEIGIIAETFRHYPGVLRSSHPTHSFTAWGRQARDVLSTQRDNNPLGPLKKLNVMQGHVLLLGASSRVVTAIHIAAERPGPIHLGRRTAVRVNAAGYDERVVLENVPGCSLTFGRLDEHLDPSKMRSAQLPSGIARKIPIRYLVQLATRLLDKDPTFFLCDSAQCPTCGPRRDALAATLPANG